MSSVKQKLDLFLMLDNKQKLQMLLLVFKKQLKNLVKKHPVWTILLFFGIAHCVRKALKPLKPLRDEVVLITGAASGLGRNLAHRFVAQGSTVVLWDVMRNQLDQVVNDLRAQGGEVLAEYVDLCNREEIEQAAKSVQRQLSARQKFVTILINNAGVVNGAYITHLDPAKIERTFKVNVLAHFWTIQAFLPAMITANRGHVVTIASAAGQNGIAMMTDYCASKFAAVGLDESLRLELQHRHVDGVKTTCIMPFYINTGMFDGVTTNVPLLLPILQENDVCASIIRAIQKEQAVMKIPWIVYSRPLMEAFLPTGALDFVSKLLGINSSMDTFRGRGHATNH